MQLKPLNRQASGGSGCIFRDTQGSIRGKVKGSCCPVMNEIFHVHMATLD